MKKMSVKNLVLGGISLCAVLFLLVGLGFSGGFDFYFGSWVNILYSVLNILALLATVALLLLNVVMFATAKCNQMVGILTTIIVVIVVGLRFLISTVLFSIVREGFYFNVSAFMALILAAIPLIAYFVCRIYLKDEIQAEKELPVIETSAEEVETKGEKVTEKQIDACIMAVKDFVPADKILFLRDTLEGADERSYKRISTLSLKSPTTVLLFSIFLGGLGVDRFYIGDTLIGVLKLLFGWLTGCIWIIIDIFLCRKKVKEKNIEQVMRCIVR